MVKILCPLLISKVGKKWARAEKLDSVHKMFTEFSQNVHNFWVSAHFLPTFKNKSGQKKC